MGGLSGRAGRVLAEVVSSVFLVIVRVWGNENHIIPDFVLVILGAKKTRFIGSHDIGEITGFSFSEIFSW